MRNFGKVEFLCTSVLARVHQGWLSLKPISGQLLEKLYTYIWRIKENQNKSSPLFMIVGELDSHSIVESISKRVYKTSRSLSKFKTIH